MVTDAYNQREAGVVVALNILTGSINPEKWRGLRRLDEDDEAVLDLLQEVREWGYGKVEVNIIAHKVETAYKGFSYKRKDLKIATQST